MTVCTLKRSHEQSSGDIESIDPSVTKVAHQQSIREAAETRWSQGQPPGRVERKTARKPAQKTPIGVEYKDQPEARTTDIIFLRFVLLRIGDVQIAMDVLDAERREMLRHLG